MRQGQQNRRGRGRTNRKGQNHQNPLMRTYQSNGPDQKIHGTPAQIAEKYISLARDALSSGDPVLAENYLQHAEHYNRIILTFREQQVQQGGEAVNGSSRRVATLGGENFDGEDGDDDGDDGQPEFGGSPAWMDQPRQGEYQPRGFDQSQLRSDDRPSRPQGEGHRDNGSRDGNRAGFRARGYPQDRNQDRNDRQNRPQRDRPARGEQYRPERGEQFRPERNEQARPERSEQFRPERSEQARPERNEQPKPERTEAFPAERARKPDRPPSVDRSEGVDPRPAPARRSTEVFAEPSLEHEQPEFLRRPVRRSRKAVAVDATETIDAPQPPDDTATES